MPKKAQPSDPVGSVLRALNFHQACGVVGSFTFDNEKWTIDFAARNVRGESVYTTEQVEMICLGLAAASSVYRPLLAASVIKVDQMVEMNERVAATLETVNQRLQRLAGAPIPGGPIQYEARCSKCGETFNPNGPFETDPSYLEHYQTEAGEECGGAGVLLGCWSSGTLPT